MCEFCKKFDFGVAKCQVDKYGVRISNLESLTSRAKLLDVMDCPKCGCQNTIAVRLPAIRKQDEESEAGEDD